MTEVEKRILQNQIEIMWYLHRELERNNPNLIGRNGEVDRMRDDFFEACRESKKLLEQG